MHSPRYAPDEKMATQWCFGLLAIVVAGLLLFFYYVALPLIR